MAGNYCAHRIRTEPDPTSGPPNGYSVWCRKSKDHTSPGHTYWASGMHVKWTPEGEVVETSGASVWAVGIIYPTRGPIDG